MFPWETVLPVPCPTSRVLLGNATWAKEAPVPFLPELCASHSTQHLSGANRTAPPRSHSKPEARAPKLEPKHRTFSHLPHQASPPGTPGVTDWRSLPQATSIPGLWRQAGQNTSAICNTHPPPPPALPEKQAAPRVRVSVQRGDMFPSLTSQEPELTWVLADKRLRYNTSCVALHSTIIVRTCYKVLAVRMLFGWGH